MKNTIAILSYYRKNRKFKDIVIIPERENIIKTFHKLTNFQQWVLFYMKTEDHILQNIEDELPNFCDTTKKNVDMNNYESHISGLQKELEYFKNVGIFYLEENQGYKLSKKGELYCYQNLELNLKKFSTTAIVNKLKNTEIYKNHLNYVIKSQIDIMTYLL